MLREIIPTDLAKIHAIECRNQSHPWSQAIFKQNMTNKHKGWVIEDNDSIIGFIIIQLVADEMQILNISVHPSAQNKGYGKRLLEHALNYAKLHGANAAFLEVRASNEKAIGLYQHLGFNQIGLRQNYYPSQRVGFEDALIFAYQF